VTRPLGQVLGLALFVFFAPMPTEAGKLELEGKFTQGGLVHGATDPAAQVTFEGRWVRVSPRGAFLIGFSRDAPEKAVLRVRFPDGSTVQKNLDIAKRRYRIQRIDGLPPEMVVPPTEALKRIRRENALIGKARRRDTSATHFENGWIWPAEGRVSGVYGSQRILNGKPKQPHYGLDIAAPAGSPVVAPADGRVALVAPDMYYTGGTVILDHGHGLTSAFLHMSEVGVAEGEFVNKGDRIGAVGATGRVTGPHLDWRVNLFAARLDPAFLLPPRPPATSPGK
jgi:murein DD-endopeptidase MepM/ murein hydrolase activator NlpD